MTVQIDLTAENNGVRFVTQGSHPSAPAAGHVLLYYVTGTANPGMFIEDPSGNKYGPLITGTNAGVIGVANFDASGASIGGLYKAGVISGVTYNSVGNFTVNLSPSQSNISILVSANETGGGGGGVSCWITSASGNFQSPTASFVFRTLSGNLGANINPTYVTVTVMKL